MPIIFPEPSSESVVAAAVGAASTPHLLSPLTFNRKGEAVICEQDSEQEIANCVLNIASCVEGTREDNPSFGIPDLTFTTVPVDAETIREAIIRWEPRATEMDATEAEEAATPAYRRVTLEV